MKLATWNSCGKFDTNLGHLLDLGVDVAVVCEAVAPATWPTTPDGRIISGLDWHVRSDSWKQLVVLACAPWSVARHDEGGSAPDWTLPVRVLGPVPFTLLALWPVKFAGTPDYVPQIDRAVDWIEKFASDEPVVLAGDFNAPITSSLAQYARVVERLQDLGLVDTHRTSRGLTADAEPTEATYFQHRRSEKPFHIDHVVVPSTWARRATVEIGDFDTWVGSGRSDHVPVLVDVPDDDMR